MSSQAVIEMPKNVQQALKQSEVRLVHLKLGDGSFGAFRCNLPDRILLRLGMSRLSNIFWKKGDRAREAHGDM